MSWICPLCSTANLDTDPKCIVCETDKPSKERDLIDALKRLKRTKKVSGDKTGQADFEQGMDHYSHRQYDKAFPFFLQAATDGHAAAANMVGDCYYY